MLYRGVGANWRLASASGTHRGRRPRECEAIRLGAAEHCHGDAGVVAERPRALGDRVRVGQRLLLLLLRLRPTLFALSLSVYGKSVENT